MGVLEHGSLFLLFSGTDFKYLPPVSATATVTNLIPALLPAPLPQPHHHATRTLTLVPNKPQSSDFYSYSRSPFSGNLGHLHTPHSPYFPSVSVYGGNWDPLCPLFCVRVRCTSLFSLSVFSSSPWLWWGRWGGCPLRLRPARYSLTLRLLHVFDNIRYAL